MIVNEIFNSIDGEVNRYGQGKLSTFIRLAGCNLRCTYCDTVYAQETNSGKHMSVEEVFDEICVIGCSKITITGGSSLLQFGELEALLNRMLHTDFFITIETNGSLPFKLLRYRNVSFVVDYKLPDSGMMTHMMNDSEFVYLDTGDFIKFVVSSRDDYEWAMAKVRYLFERGVRCQTAFSANEVPHRNLLTWLQEDKFFDCYLNVQIHKEVNLK